MIVTKNIFIDRLNHTISHKGVTRQFSERSAGNHQFELAAYFILAGGASKEMAFYHLYANDPEGGPLEGPHIINVKINQLARDKLAPLGLEIRSWKISGVSFYEIVPTYELLTPNRFSYRRGELVARGGAPINSRPVA